MFKGTDFRILIVALAIACLGILSIYSSTYQKEGGLWQVIYQRQLLWVILGLCLFFLVSCVNYRRIWDATYFLYAFMLLMLLLVFVLGIVRLGAQRWLKFIWFNFQPSEIAKLIIVIFLARYFSAKSLRDISLPVERLGIRSGLVLPFLFIAVPLALIAEQPDLGSACMILFIFITMVYLAGIRLRYLIMISVAVAVCLPFGWHYLRDYQRERLMVFLNPNIDPLGAGYTIIQSKIAIGSGGLFGKGWLSGTQSQLHFLPESHTDFVFATFAEEWGLVGVVGLLLLYYLLISRGLSIAQRTGDSFGKLLAIGISLMLGIQIVINISMNLGLLPIVGLPLPLMSYGGSSVLVTFISLGILANIGRTRTAY